MRDHSLDRDTHDPLGWLKTAGVVVVLFAAMLVSAVGLARADTCAPNCRATHNECRLRTKGAPQCDAQLQACLTSCMATRTPPPSSNAAPPAGQPRR